MVAPFAVKLSIFAHRLLDLAIAFALALLLLIPFSVDAQAQTQTFDVYARTFSDGLPNGPSGPTADAACVANGACFAGGGTGRACFTGANCDYAAYSVVKKTVTCYNGQVFNYDLGACNDPPDPQANCVYGSLHQECRVKCEPTVFHTGGYTGYQMECPGGHIEDQSDLTDYACLGKLEDGSPDTWANHRTICSQLPGTLDESQGPIEVDGSTINIGDVTTQGHTRDDLLSDGSRENPSHQEGGAGSYVPTADGNFQQVPLEPVPLDTYNCLNQFFATGSLPPGCDPGEIPTYSDISQLDHNCDGGLPTPCDEPQDFEDQNLIEACRLNPGLPWCETETIVDVCSHGGLPDPVVLCDYTPNPATGSCPHGSVPTADGGCAIPPAVEVPAVDPEKVPPIDPETPPPPSKPKTTTTTTTSQTTTTDGEGNSTTTTTTTITTSTEQSNEQGAGQCDPTAANYLECIGGGEPPEPTQWPDSQKTGQDLQAAGQGFIDQLSTVPIVAAGADFAGVFTGGTGTCPAPTFSAFGQTFALDYHCTLYSQISGILSAVMLVFYSLVGLRNVMSA